jgi:hypothetical protein
MSILRPSFLDTISIPKKQLPLYYFLRGLLFVAFFLITGFIGYSFLFPSQSFSFDFRNPDAAKNTLLDPRDDTGIPIRKGSVEKNSNLIVNGGALGMVLVLAVTRALVGPTAALVIVPSMGASAVLIFAATCALAIPYGCFGRTGLEVTSPRCQPTGNK